MVLTPEGRRRHDKAFVEHMRIIEREFGGRLTPAEQQAVADALAGFWHDDLESPTTTGQADGAQPAVAESAGAWTVPPPRRRRRGRA